MSATTLLPLIPVLIPLAEKYGDWEETKWLLGEGLDAVSEYFDEYGDEAAWLAGEAWDAVSEYFKDYGDEAAYLYNY